MFIQCTTFIFWNFITQKTVKYVLTKRLSGFSPSFIYCNTACHDHSYSFWRKISSPYSSKREGSSAKLHSEFGVTYLKIHDVWMKRRALKAKEDFSFWSSAKICKGLSKIIDGVKSFLQRGIICHPRLIQSPISNN